jgi:CBS domain-containing protein
VLLSEVMTRDVHIIHPDTTIEDAAKKMKQLDVGVLPVADKDNLFGIVTDRDITIRATAEGRDPKRTTVRDVITEDVVYAFEDDDVKDGARIMQEKQIRRLLVVDRDKRLVGIVSLGDLAVDTGFKRMTAETLQKVSEPAEPRR